ncbi:carbohydrate kinase [Thermococcus sp. M36]|uniref:PfkB family carbohydrate kinase n=1 Tax=Thermococcus sp. M36 TaxID=1638261 RepID=UPI001439BEBB|nr:carbohydrate kinase [Thermococcus sp. M36]NJE05025.1 carbohydrate kinase [Thermococcus sp. M36]
MKCLLVGHLVIDIIVRDAKPETRIGGGAYYSAVALANFCDVEVLTSVGDDFPDEWLEALERAGIKLRALPSDKSTSYELRYLDPNRRTLRLLSRATPISKAPTKRYDMVLLNPVANEIPPDIVEKLKKKTAFLAADVQGFIRTPRPGNVMLQKADVSFLKGLKVVHADTSEMDYLKNLKPEEVEVFLASNGPETGFAYFRGSRYAYRPVRVEVKESTGAGDVFLASFSYFYTRCPFVQALKRANAFTALFLEHRAFNFSEDDVNKLAMKVGVEKLTI